MKNEAKIKMNQEKLKTLLNVMDRLQRKVPDDKKLKEVTYKGQQLFEEGTSGIKVEKFGVMIPNSELTPFRNYIEQCISNGEAEELVLGIYTHNNNRAENNSRGICDYEKADFAEIGLITSERIIAMYLNYMNPLTKKIGNYVEVKNTSWKKLPDIRGRNRREILIDRVVIISALHYEKLNNCTVRSKTKFIDIFNHIEAIEPSELGVKMKIEGAGETCRISFEDDDLSMNILKMVYNKLKNESMRLVGTGAFNDMTYIAFEYGKKTIAFDLSLNNKIVEFEK